MAHTLSSPLLNALEQARLLAQAETLAPMASPLDVPLVEPPSERRWGRHSEPAPLTTAQVDRALSTIDDVTAQLTLVQAWLRNHPLILQVVDQGLRNEVAAMEARVVRTNVRVNITFTVLGALLGVLLPQLGTLIAMLLSQH